MVAQVFDSHFFCQTQPYVLTCMRPHFPYICILPVLPGLLV